MSLAGELILDTRTGLGVDAGGGARHTGPALDMVVGDFVVGGSVGGIDGVRPARLRARSPVRSLRLLEHDEPVREHAGVIRRLAPDEVELLKELRLSALADAPSAFAATHEQEAAYADDDWRFLLRPEGHPAFVWEDERGTQGMVVGVQDGTEANVVHLFAMWVRPSARGGGAADALVAQVVEWARGRSALFVRLHVASGNERAERLYARHGFVRTGRSRVRERDGLVENEMQTAL